MPQMSPMSWMAICLTPLSIMTMMIYKKNHNNINSTQKSNIKSNKKGMKKWTW